MDWKPELRTSAMVALAFSTMFRDKTLKYNFRTKSMMTLQKGNLTYTSDANFENDVLKSELPVFVDFYADWCGPCRIIEPIMEQLSQEYHGKVRFVKVDVDSTPQTAANYSVMSIPTLIVFRGGKEVKRIVGAASRDHYVREIQRVLQS